MVCICAGFTWVDGCERQPQQANKMNSTGPAVLAAAAAAAGAKVVWYSTDYVFDGGVCAGGAGGKVGPYSEGDAVSPLNVYGASKLAGEKAVLKADPTAIVIRTNVVYGPEVERTISVGLCYFCFATDVGSRLVSARPPLAEILIFSDPHRRVPGTR